MWTLVTLLIFTAIVLPYVSMNYDEPLSTDQWQVLELLLKIAFAKAVTVFLVSFATANYSQVDKLWSIMPVIYVWVAAIEGGLSSRQILMASVITFWGIRLTYNFARKGGYSWRFWQGEEDYRWAELRKNPYMANPILWFIFNLTFISFY